MTELKKTIQIDSDTYYELRERLVAEAMKELYESDRDWFDSDYEYMRMTMAAKDVLSWYLSHSEFWDYFGEKMT